MVFLEGGERRRAEVARAGDELAADVLGLLQFSERPGPQGEAVHLLVLAEQPVGEPAPGCAHESAEPDGGKRLLWKRGGILRTGFLLHIEDERGPAPLVRQPLEDRTAVERAIREPRGGRFSLREK